MDAYRFDKLSNKLENKLLGVNLSTDQAVELLQLLADSIRTSTLNVPGGEWLEVKISRHSKLVEPTLAALPKDAEIKNAQPFGDHTCTKIGTDNDGKIVKWEFTDDRSPENRARFEKAKAAALGEQASTLAALAPICSYCLNKHHAVECKQGATPTFEVEPGEFCICKCHSSPDFITPAKPKPVEIQKPTVGRIVHFYDRWLQAGEGKPWAAIVVAVGEDNRVNILAIDAGGCQHAFLSIPHKDASKRGGYWEYPPRV